MSDSDDITQDPTEATKGYAESAQTSADRGDAEGGFGGGAGSEEHHQPGGRGARDGVSEPQAKVHPAASPHDMDLQAGASSGGTDGQDGRGGFATDPAEAAGLLPDPERPEDAQDDPAGREQAEDG